MEMPKKILFIGIHRLDRSPSQRFRFEQYLSFLERNGFTWELSYIISEEEDKFFYKSGHYLRKLGLFIRAVFIRLSDVRRANQYDIIFIQRESFMVGGAFFEKMFSRSKAKIVYDFDDAIWLQHISEENKMFKWLKKPQKIATIIALSDMVFAGNSYLEAYAKKFNSNVKLIPTTIDTTYHKPLVVSKKNNSVCIGWTGTFSTLKYFEHILPVLKRVKEQFGDQVYFKIIADREKEYEEIGTNTTLWNANTEIEDLNELDIGIMPLPDDEWTKGKCGFKGLQYMAISVATIMSDVGANKDIIKHGINGYLVATMEEWYETITMLINDKAKRKLVGEEGRKTVQEQFSVEANKAKYLNYLNELLMKP